MARLISRLDPAVLGLRVAAGDPALDDLAGESNGLPLQNPNAAAPQDRYVAIEANIADLHLSIGEVPRPWKAAGPSARNRGRTVLGRSVNVIMRLRAGRDAATAGRGRSAPGSMADPAILGPGRTAW
jgi:hypothetical protein